jgi:hypothetical protein
MVTLALLVDTSSIDVLGFHTHEDIAYRLIVYGLVHQLTDIDMIEPINLDVE